MSWVPTSMASNSSSEMRLRRGRCSPEEAFEFICSRDQVALALIVRSELVLEGAIGEPEVGQGIDLAGHEVRRLRRDLAEQGGVRGRGLLGLPCEAVELLANLLQKVRCLRDPLFDEFDRRSEIPSMPSFSRIPGLPSSRPTMSAP